MIEMIYAYVFYLCVYIECNIFNRIYIEYIIVLNA